MVIGDRLKQIRESKNMSQGDVKSRTGLLRCYVSRVENGHTVPSLETLHRWAMALEVEVWQLFFEGGQMPQPVVAAITEPSDGRDNKLLAVLREVNEADRELVLGLARKMAGK